MRVNLDGETDEFVAEIKTYRDDKHKAYKMPLSTWQQCQVQAWATKKQVVVYAYRVTQDEYDNFFLDIDPRRLSENKVSYDDRFINDYLARVKYLSECLLRGTD